MILSPIYVMVSLNEESNVSIHSFGVSESGSDSLIIY